MDFNVSLPLLLSLTGLVCGAATLYLWRCYRTRQHMSKMRTPFDTTTILTDITHAATLRHNLLLILPQLSQRIRDVFGVQECIIDLWDSEDANRSNIPAWVAEHRASSVPTKRTSQMIDTSATESSNTPYQAILELPLTYGYQQIGTLILANHTPLWTSDTIRKAAEHVADTLALAMGHSLLQQRYTQQQAWLEAITTASHDGVVIFGTPTSICLINDGAIRLLQLPGTQADWIGKPWEALIEPLSGSLDELATKLQLTIEQIHRGDTTSVEGEYHLEANTVHWKFIPVGGFQNRIGWLLVLRDVTEARTLEQTRNELVQTMVHDLRNPLSVISSSLMMLEQSYESNNDAREVIAIASRSTRRMLQLVNAILDVNRLESGNMPLDFHPYTPAELVQDIVQQLTPLADAQHLEISVDVPRSLPAILVDGSLVGRVLQNLLDNAIKFSRSYSTIKIVAAVKDPGFLTLSVHDTGCGIPDSLRGRLFEKFVTGNSQHSGSGLGLAFCRLAVEAHGGTIALESVMGSGTTFNIRLPIACDIDPWEVNETLPLFS